MSGRAVVRQAAMGEVCAGVPKSALCSALVPSIGDFERALLAPSANCRCSRRLKARSWPQNRGNPANVGLGKISDQTILPDYFYMPEIVATVESPSRKSAILSLIMMKEPKGSLQDRHETGA
jgi:hypothetical protein